MPRAFCLIREQPQYRHDAFLSGLRRLGYEVHQRVAADIRPDDCLVLWNRYGEKDGIARTFEAIGAPVLIAENGYCGRDADGHQLYALSRNFHNGEGFWHVGAEPRWREQGIELQPWRTAGEEILIVPQRGFGASSMPMPKDWAEKTQAALRGMTARPVRIRPHPGNAKPALTIEEDLHNAWAVVTWGSSGAIKALMLGVPVFYCFPPWIAKEAAIFGFKDVESPFRGSREAAFHKIGWGQWSAAEISEGLPFEYLLERNSAAA